MKLLITLALLSFSAPTAFADTWQNVRCSYKRNNIPDDDRGTSCHQFYTCVDQGKRAFIIHRPGVIDRVCCNARRQNCTPAYSGD